MYRLVIMIDFQSILINDVWFTNSNDWFRKYIDVFDAINEKHMENN